MKVLVEQQVQAGGKPHARGEHAAGREQVQPVAQDDEKENAGDERRGGLEHERGEGRPQVEGAVAPPGHDHAQADADREGEAQPGPHEKDGVPEAVDEDVEDRLLAGKGAAPVQRHEVLEKQHVLHVQGLVQAVGLLQPGLGHGVERRGDDLGRGVPGDHPEEDEQDGGDRKDGHHHVK